MFFGGGVLEQRLQHHVLRGSSLGPTRHGDVVSRGKFERDYPADWLVKGESDLQGQPPHWLQEQHYPQGGVTCGGVG